MHRFFADPAAIGQTHITLPEEDARHLHVLRLEPEELVTVCDGMGTDYRCTVEQLNRRDAVLRIEEAAPAQGESPLRITLFQGLPKQDKMELIIQKCVELGVYDIVPVETARCVAKAGDNPKERDKKQARWQKISMAAAQQCGRGIVPHIHHPVSFQQAVAMAAALPAAFMAYEDEKTTSIKTAFSGFAGERTGIFIGPEGGFTPQEAGACREKGIVPVSLGKRIVRTETAGFMAIIMLHFMHGEDLNWTR